MNILRLMEGLGQAAVEFRRFGRLEQGGDALAVLEEAGSAA
jgi:hypothetical protein